MIKIGRRGSLSGVSHRQRPAGTFRLSASRRQSACAALMQLADALLDAGLRRRHQGFPADQSGDHLDRRRQSGDQRHPGKGDASPSISASTTAGPPRRCRREIHNRLDRAARRKTYRKGRKEPVDFELVWRDRPSHVFLTRDDQPDRDARAARSRPSTGRTPRLSTSGGTSDARFIKDYCPVVEFGLVGKTMHMVDERVALADLETLTDIYQRFLRGMVRLEHARGSRKSSNTSPAPGA